MDTELQEYYCDIIDCLIKYGATEEAQARYLVNHSGLFDIKSEWDRINLLHELPYYWAMDLLHAADNPEWYHDPALWPPPQDNYDLLATSSVAAVVA